MKEISDMDIYSPKGTKVIFKFPNSGWDYDKEHAKKYLEEGRTYTVEHTEVHSWHTKVYLVEIPDIPFNSVHFAQCEEE